MTTTGEVHRIDFDAWLLARAPLYGCDRLVHLLSQVIGPPVLLAAVAMGLVAHL